MTSTLTSAVPAASFSCPMCSFTARVEAVRKDLDWLARPATTCRTCGGSGTVHFDPAAIVAAVVATRGKNKGQLRASAPGDAAPFGAKTVWRLVRFDVGHDVCLPVMCWDHVGVLGVLDENAKAVMGYVETLAKAVAVDVVGPLKAFTGVSAWGRVVTGHDLPGLDTAGIGEGTDRREGTISEW